MDLRHRQNKHLPARQFVHFSKWLCAQIIPYYKLVCFTTEPLQLSFLVFDNVARAVKKLHGTGVRGACHLPECVTARLQNYTAGPR